MACLSLAWQAIVELPAVPRGQRTALTSAAFRSECAKNGSLEDESALRGDIATQEPNVIHVYPRAIVILPGVLQLFCPNNLQQTTILLSDSESGFELCLKTFLFNSSFHYAWLTLHPAPLKLCKWHCINWTIISLLPLVRSGRFVKQEQRERQRAKRKLMFGSKHRGRLRESGDITPGKILRLYRLVIGDHHKTSPFEVFFATKISM